MGRCQCCQWEGEEQRIEDVCIVHIGALHSDHDNCHLVNSLVCSFVYSHAILLLTLHVYDYDDGHYWLRSGGQHNIGQHIIHNHNKI